MTTGSIIPGSGVRMLNKGLVTFPSNNKSGNRERTETEWLVGVRVELTTLTITLILTLTLTLTPT